MKHRRAPLPASMNRPPTAGRCRWCDLPILLPDGRPSGLKWHPACVNEFKLIHWPAVTRKAVWIRDRGICQRCGRDLAAEAHAIYSGRTGRTIESLRLSLPSWAPKWQHDHIRPLIEARGDLSFWELENVQVLCHLCHIAKGKEDNRRRRHQADAQKALPL